ncbi:U6 snRNA phosphodiesterase [Halotydeus destructor]|nr:U6 snRNA phosphodiesterase [Halotydeus destructor]
MSRLPVLLKSPAIDGNDGGQQLQECNEMGQVRTYAHERGQWTEHIGINLPSDQLSNLMAMSARVANVHVIEKAHISLSRGHFVLRYHQLEPFVDALTTRIQSIKSFSLCLDQVQILYNDETSRGFVCLCDSRDASEPFTRLANAVDTTRAEFGVMGKVYPEPFIVHASLFWFVPEFLADAEKLVQELQDELNDEPLLVDCRQVNVNLGNFREHQITLKKR